MRKPMLGLGLALCLVAVSAAAEGDDDKSGGAKAAEGVQGAADTVKSEAQGAASGAGMKHVGGGKYGPAGCGLGSLIFKPDSGITQIFAATTNGTSGNQTFGITSGTSNCDGSSGGSESARAFVQSNRAALAKDIARGRGATIDSLSELGHCRDPRAVGVRLKSQFSTIFPSARTSDQAVSDRVVSTLASDRALGCSNLI